MTDVDARAESVIFHELAGLLSSLWSMAEIVSKRPDHPDREEFISLLRTETRKAARTFKDLQNLRALMADNLAERIETVDIAEVLGAADAMGEAESPEGERSTGAAVLADTFVLADLIARLRDLASELGGSATDEVEADTDAVTLVYGCGPPENRAELIEGLERGDGRARMLFVMQRIVARWGAKVRVDETASVIVSLKRAGA
ncbi:MAG: hypothetical protein ACRDJV_09225 [Actinomycetota bacterium]